MKPAKRLILARHAKSSWKDPDLLDFERPLNNRGRRNGPVMAKFISRELDPPDLVLCSSSVRTRHTARFFLSAGFFDGSVIRYEPSLYEAHFEDIVRQIRRTDQSVGTLMLIGHNPWITETCNFLAPTDALENIPTLGVAELALSIAHWHQADRGVGRLTAYHIPRELA